MSQQSEPTKPCTRCGEVKSRLLFSLKYDGTNSRRGYCRQCEIKKQIARQQARKAFDPEYRDRLSRAWRQAHERRRGKKNERRCERLRTCPELKLRYRLASQLRKGLCRDKCGIKTFDAVGYTAGDLRAHLERQFTKRMTWENYGARWHIDHILPMSSFKLTNEDGSIDWDEVRRCWALSNLRPLPTKANISKGAKRLHLV